MYENYLDSRRYSLVHPAPFPAFDPGDNRSRGKEALMEPRIEGNFNPGHNRSRRQRGEAPGGGACANLFMDFPPTLLKKRITLGIHA